MTPVMLSSKKRTTVFSICECHFLSSIHPPQCPQKERAEAKAKLIRKWYSSNVKEEFAVLTRLFSCHEPSSHSSCHDIPSLTSCGHITRSGNILHRLQQVSGRGSLTDAAARRPTGWPSGNRSISWNWSRTGNTYRQPAAGRGQSSKKCQIERRAHICSKKPIKVTQYHCQNIILILATLIFFSPRLELLYSVTVVADVGLVDCECDLNMYHHLAQPRSQVWQTQPSSTESGRWQNSKAYVGRR